MQNDQLDPVLAKPKPPAASLNLGYRDGIIITFNQLTLENTVNIGGTVMTNLPLLGLAEASSYVPGSVVGILATTGTLGTSSYAILGRLVTPGSAIAADALSTLSSWIHVDTVSTQETTASLAYTDLDTPGPQVSVPVRKSGRVLIMITAQIERTDSDPTDGWGGFVSCEVTGANTITAATFAGALLLESFDSVTTSPAATSISGSKTLTGMAVVNGLVPGDTTFRLVYSAANSEATDFGRRTVLVLAL